MPDGETKIVVMHGDRSAIVLKDPDLVAAVIRMAHEHLPPHETAVAHEAFQARNEEGGDAG